MTTSLPRTVAQEPAVEPVIERPDLRELEESASSLGSFGLRWHLTEPAPAQKARP